MEEILLRLLDAGYEVTLARGIAFGYYAVLCDSSGRKAGTSIGLTPSEALDRVVPDEMRVA